MTKSPDAFRTISEVATWLDVQAHVLRFWESKFPQVKPVKRAGGRRYYRPADMRLLGGIKTLLHDDGMTIKGVQKILREQGVVHVIGLSPPLDGEAIDASPAGGTVLAFKAKSPPEATAPTPKIVDRGPVETPATPSAQVPAAPVAPTPALPPAHVAPSSPAATASGLPSFLNKPTTAPATPPAEHSGLTAQGRDSAPHVPDLPKTEPTKSEPAKSEPPEAELPEPEPPYTPGPLGHLAGLAALSPRQANQIAPLTRALRAWYDRNADAGRG
ncbi:MAG: MerR family transcriptional regulator [Pseudodonghicola sp.]|nr:MerR family transcriptional regulator [Pseudodonghicola sp.]